MKKLALLIFVLLFIHKAANSQSPCLPEGISFYYQSEIDNFQTNYPGCTEIEGDVRIYWEDINNLNGLNVLTSIGDSLIIISTNLVNLSGLNSLTSIGGGLYLDSNSSLSSLSGLEALTTIGIDLDIWSNNALINLAGLGGLTSIGGGLWIGYNEMLVSLNGLDDLPSIGSHLYIYNNDALLSLSGLAGLTSIPGNLYITGNDAINNLMGLGDLMSIGGKLTIQNNDGITSLSGLEGLNSIGEYLKIALNDALSNLDALNNLTSVGGELYISSNNALTSLSGLSNINAASITDLSIFFNSSLHYCDIQNICDYLASPNGSVTIFSNASGCDNPTEVANACGIALPCLPYGNYYFNSQSDIDNFQSNYPGCTELEGNVTITQCDNLMGLNVVTYVGGILEIYGNGFFPANLTGLESLTNIGGGLSLWGNSLSSLTGLDNVTSIGGNLEIGDGYTGNPELTSLTGLQGLNSIGGELLIFDNDVLTNISALENINSGSITDLSIYNNNALAICDILSICNYLTSPNGIIEVHDNAPGCNSPEEVKLQCPNTVEEINTGNGFTITPNPSKDKVTISLPGINNNTQLSIFNVNGEKVIEKPLNDNETQIDISALPRGVYFMRLQDDYIITMKKIIKN
jgi:hypothetical protein